MRCILYFLILLICFSPLTANDVISVASQDATQYFAKDLDSDKIFSVFALEGNYSNEFTKIFMVVFENNYGAKFIDYELQKEVIKEKIKYSEPVFEQPNSLLEKKLQKPELTFKIKANLYENSELLKKRETLSLDINLLDIDTGLILKSYKKSFHFKYRPKIIYLIAFIIFIIVVSRFLIYLNNGYNVKAIVVFSMILIFLSIVWYIY
jgi:hypothetical protein